MNRDPLEIFFAGSEAEAAPFRRMWRDSGLPDETIWRTSPGENTELALIPESAPPECAAAALDQWHGPVFFIGRALNPAAAETLRLVCDRARSRAVNARLAAAAEPGISNPVDPAFAAIVTASPRMRELFALCRKLACDRYPVLIRGESGTGKELLAEAMHRASGRRGTFEALNVCESGPELFADALFGHVRGAFTGAERNYRGAVERTAGGTLFIDEIGDLDAAGQVKLLRLVQNREYRMIGGEKCFRTDAHFIFATHRDLAKLVREGGFREDLFYRIAAHTVHIPPLRERAEDIELLARHFARKYACENHLPEPKFGIGACDELRRHAFPGNVRELEGVIADVFARSPGRSITAAAFRTRLAEAPPVPPPERAIHLTQALQALDVLPDCRSAEAMLIEEALRRTRDNIPAAARMLGLDARTLCARHQKH